MARLVPAAPAGMSPVWMLVVTILLAPHPGTSLSRPMPPPQTPPPAEPNDNLCVLKRCPTYRPSVLDGKVCVGCFRDDYELYHWDRLSPLEKACALEDASDRARSIEARAIALDNDGNDSKPPSAEELNRQALAWRAWGERDETMDAPASKAPESEDSTYDTSIESAAVAIPSTVVTVTSQSNASLASESEASTVDAAETTVLTRSTATVSPPSSGSDSAASDDAAPEWPAGLPPTPCTRICRYNAACFDGRVCIGCFRDTHEIAAWSGLSAGEKALSLCDAADRCGDLSAMQHNYEGGISRTALLEQASLWDVLARSNRRGG